MSVQEKLHAPGPKKRYDGDLSQEGSNALSLPQIKAGDVQPLQLVERLGDLQTVGHAAAIRTVRTTRLEDFETASTR